MFIRRKTKESVQSFISLNPLAFAHVPAADLIQPEPIFAKVRKTKGGKKQNTIALFLSQDKKLID
jgi:hypothetical protein